MRQCIHCQADLPRSAQFCSYCGMPVEQDQNQPIDAANGEGEQGQNQSADDMSIEVEPREDLSQVEEDQNQFAEATHDDVASGTDAFQAEENHLSETAQPDGMLPEQNADEAGQEQDSSDETGRETETLILPSEDSPVSEQYPPTMSSEDIPENAEQQAMPDMLALDSNQPVQTVQDESAWLEPQFPPTRSEKRKARTGTILLVVVLIVVILLAGGAGTFALLHQNTSAGVTSQCAGQPSGCVNHAQGNGLASATRLAFSGTVSGPMTISAQPRCQGTTMEKLRTLMVTLSGIVGGQFYNFGFVINRYLGPGTYRNSTTSTTILLDVPGEATDNGWGNASPTDTGSITIAQGEQTGSITSVLSGFGSQAGTQIQVSGNWTCG